MLPAQSQSTPNPNGETSDSLSGRASWLAASKTTKNALKTLGYTTLNQVGAPGRFFDDLHLCEVLRNHPDRGAEIQELYVTLKVYEACSFTKEFLPNLRKLHVKELPTNPFRSFIQLLSIWDEMYAQFPKIEELELSDRHNRLPTDYIHAIYSKEAHTKKLKELLDTGRFDVNRRTIVLGSTLLHDAASNEYLEEMQILLDKGANIEAIDETKHTPLHYASWSGREEATRLLLERKANIKAQTVKGNTPLMEYALHQPREHLGIARMLINADETGEMLLMRNHAGKTALDIARSSDRNDVVQLIERRIEALPNQQP